MIFRGITHETQGKYNLPSEQHTGDIEFEAYDSAETIIDNIYNKAPLIGEVLLPEEAYNTLLQKGREIFQRLTSGERISLTQRESRMLMASVVFLAQRQADGHGESGQMWDYILTELGREPAWRQAAYNRLCDLVMNTVNIKTQGGQRYYNTIRLQAIAPAASVLDLYEIIFRFYRDNLDYQYDEAENAFLILSEKIQSIISGIKGDGEIKLGAYVLPSCVRYLFLDYPQYMAAVCDAIAKKMDILLRGEEPKLNENNRWDTLLRQWFHAFCQREQPRRDRTERTKQRIITRRDCICPEYSLSQGQLQLTVPRIRVGEITQRPTIQLYQDGSLVLENGMSVYGNELCYTTHEYQFELNNIENIEPNAPLHFQIKILCTGNAVYDSGNSLYREYLLFDTKGAEKQAETINGAEAYIVASRNAQMQVVAPQEDYCDESTRFTVMRVQLSKAQHIYINTTDIIAHRRRTMTVQGFCTPYSVSGVSAIAEDKEYSVFQKEPILHLSIGDNENSRNYRIRMDSNNHQLYEYFGEKRDADIRLPGAPHFLHSVDVVDTQGRIRWQTKYIILPDISIHFTKAYYLDREDGGDVQIKVGGYTKTYHFSLIAGQKTAVIPIENYNYSLQLKLPKLEVTMDGENIVFLPKDLWHEDIQQACFVRASVPPNGVSLKLIFNGSEVPSLNDGNVFELGNFLFSLSPDKKVRECDLGMLIWANGDGVPEQYKLVTVHFEPCFLASPIAKSGRTLTWNGTLDFIGPEDMAFAVELENDQSGEPWIFCDLREGKAFEKNFSCTPGTYHCCIVATQATKSPFAQQETQHVVWEEDFAVAEQPETRFAKKAIRLTRTYFWLPATEKDEKAEIFRTNAVIYDIAYDSFGIIQGVQMEQVHLYRGSLFFRSPAGKWCEMNRNQESKDYEWVNPVTFFFTKEGRIRVYNPDSQPILIDASCFFEKKPVRILNRKYERHNKRLIAISDEFEFEEEEL